MSKILVVEDEESIREVITVYLRQADYNCEEAENGVVALNLLKDEKFDLMILDLNLPKIDGIEVCKRTRKSSDIPILMLTARTAEFDELVGLEAGADDYVKKPFSPALLIARVRALLRRVGGKKLEIGALTIDPDKMAVYKNEKKIVLTTTQFNVLYTLASSPGKVFTRDELLNKAYDSTLPPDILDRTIDAHIKELRKKIEEDTRQPEYVLTVIGKGYKFADISK